jgi:hypothetical protein
MISLDHDGHTWPQAQAFEIAEGGGILVVDAADSRWSA